MENWDFKINSNKNIIKKAFPDQPSLTMNLIDVGADSKVYLVESVNTKKICKLYDESNLKIEQIKKYQSFTNQLNEHLQINPFISKVKINEQEWKIELKVTLIENVVQIDNQIITTVPFVMGKNSEDIFAEINEEINQSNNECEVLKSKIILLSDSNQEISIPKKDYQELFEKTFWLGNPHRLEKQFNKQINTTLKTKQFALHPKNIKPFFNLKNKKILFQITDIGDVLYRIDDLK